ncbi:MAG: hypothetical protein ACHQU8_01465 [Gemmatimonadales bacterium]
MTFETTTSLAPADVVRRAKAFFAGRVPATAAFLEKEAPGVVVLRGQGGEEIVIAALSAPCGSAVRGSSMLFGQQVKRFFTTLPPSLADAPALAGQGAA